MMHEIERYIAEIFNFITDKFELDQIIFDIGRLSEKFNYSIIAENNQSDPNFKKQQIRKEIEDIGSETLHDYLYTLTEEDDFWLFEPNHFANFKEQFEQAITKTDIFQLTVAIQLQNEDIKRMANELSQKMEKTVILDVRISNGLIGGAIIKKDNYILDYSLKTKLTNLSEHWKKSIQKANQV